MLVILATIFLTFTLCFATVSANESWGSTNQCDPRFAVRLTNQNFDTFCSGALITILHVLTAAHCLRRRYVEDTMVVTYVKADDSEKEGHVYRIKWWKSYESWQMGTDLPILAKPIDDIAVIKLESAISEIDIRSPSLFSDSSINLLGKYARIVRWIRDKSLSDDFPVSVPVRIVSAENCAINPLATNKFLCTEDNPKINLDCKAAGGPLIIGNKLVGINHKTCSNLPSLQIHLDLNYYEDFIKWMVNNEPDEMSILTTKYPEP